MRLFGFTADRADEAVKKYRERYAIYNTLENRLYDGMKEVLINLKDKGFKLILATSKPEEFAIRILEHFQLEQYFDFVGGASMDGVRSKKADVISYALEKAGIEDLSKTVMVGDREHDILGAKEVGIDSIGVLFGYGNYEELKKAGATHIVNTVSEISSVIL